MFICYYILSDRDKQTYSTQLSHCDCVEGDRTDLVTQIESDKNFCRGRQPAMNYDFFVKTLKMNTVIYIKNESDNKILGACSIDIEKKKNLDISIILSTICVPDNGNKGIGTLLIDKVKYIGKLIDAKDIKLSAQLSVIEFYKKNGFTEHDDITIDEEDDFNDNKSMKYSFKQTSEATTAKSKKEGTRKLKSQKKNKTMNKKIKIRNKKIKITKI